MYNEGIFCGITSVEGLVYHNLTKASKSFAQEERSEADQIFLECRLTEYLQKEVERYNKHLKNFQLRLEME